MKIAISGAHSQGKTTLINDLKYTEELRKFQILGNITRGIQERGVEINEGGSNWSQSLVIAKHIEHYFTKGDCLLDRCLLDGLAYTAALKIEGKVEQWNMDWVHRVCSTLLMGGGSYDLIFYVEPHLPLIDDGVRTVNQEFFNNVVSTFEMAIRFYSVPVVRIGGTRNERVTKVIQTIKGLKI